MRGSQIIDGLVATLIVFLPTVFYARMLERHTSFEEDLSNGNHIPYDCAASTSKDVQYEYFLSVLPDYL
ncbi:hypothetical protein RB195_014804 [Necator americanus]|uniref:Amino acid transporter transmembrane domain-containing protein n=1 Tax=Necator americanus TaxID=51031 RepID=A0ABR1E3E1_NECAM